MGGRGSSQERMEYLFGDLFWATKKYWNYLWVSTSTNGLGQAVVRVLHACGWSAVCCLLYELNKGKAVGIMFLVL